MKRYVVECDICGKEIRELEWYEIKMKYFSFNRAGKTTRCDNKVICWGCKEALVDVIRNERKRTRT